LRGGRKEEGENMGNRKERGGWREEVRGEVERMGERMEREGGRDGLLTLIKLYIVASRMELAAFLSTAPFRAVPIRSPRR